mgnify:FL=1
MSLPITRKQWDAQQYLCHGWQGWAGGHLPFCQTAENAATGSAQWLIERLYKPVMSGSGVRVDNRLAKKFLREPINWGDLGASVERHGAIWIVTLEEASPGDCPTLCKYVRGWMERWGWECVVQTEW